MTYTLEDFMWIFYIYSFAGWCAGVAANAMRRKRFINTGFLNLPLCPVYGTIGIVFSVFLPELEDHWFFLALGGQCAGGSSYRRDRCDPGACIWKEMVGLQ